MRVIPLDQESDWYGIGYPSLRALVLDRSPPNAVDSAAAGCVFVFADVSVNRFDCSSTLVVDVLALTIRYRPRRRDRGDGLRRYVAHGAGANKGHSATSMMHSSDEYRSQVPQELGNLKRVIIHYVTVNSQPRADSQPHGAFYLDLPSSQSIKTERERPKETYRVKGKQTTKDFLLLSSPIPVYPVSEKPKALRPQIKFHSISKGAK